MIHSKLELRKDGADLRKGGAPLLLGISSGVIAGGCYYADDLKIVAHSLGIWILICGVLCIGQSWRAAFILSCTALGTAVCSFYVSRSVIYGFLYEGHYPLDLETILLWLSIAVAISPVFAWTGSRIRQGSGQAPFCAALYFGLLMSDAIHASTRWSWVHQLPLLAVSGVGVVLLLAKISRFGVSRIKTALWSVPVATVGLFLLSVPDALQSLFL